MKYGEKHSKKGKLEINAVGPGLWQEKKNGENEKQTTGIWWEI